MAKLTETKIEIVHTEPGYTLQLTQLEAYTLYDILCRISGRPDNTARKFSDSVMESLKPVFCRVRILDNGAMDEGASSIGYIEGSIEIAETAVAKLDK